MNSNFNEDEILTMLNNIEISENEFSSENLTEIEKKKLKKNIINTVNLKKLRVKKNIIAASIAALMLVSVPLVNSNAFAYITSKLSIIPGIGQVNIENNKGLVLKNSLEANGVTLKSLYMDDTNLIATIQLNSETKYENANYYLKDDKGTTYKLKVSMTDVDGIFKIPSTAYRLEYNGNIQKSSKYTLGVINDKAVFNLKNTDFKDAFPSGILYTATNGSTTLNVTSIEKDKNILKVYYYFTDKFDKKVTCQNIVHNYRSFKVEKYLNQTYLPAPKNSILYPHFELSDEYKNLDYAHDDSDDPNSEHESSFDLNKLKGNKLKLTLPAVTYETGNVEADKTRTDFNLNLSIPTSGKTVLNEIHSYNGFKYKLISLERLSDKKVSLKYTILDNENPKLKATSISFVDSSLPKSNNYSDDSFKNSNGNLEQVITSTKPIGDKLNLDTIYISFSSVGPFEINLDLNSLKH